MSLQMNFKTKTLIPLAVAMLFNGMPTHAVDLVGAFGAAKEADPKYQAAKSEKTATSAQSLSDRASYLPNYQYTRQQLPTLNATNYTNTVTQPIFNASLAATVGQGGPRSTLAGAAFSTSTQELAQRTLNAVNQIALAHEAIRANKAQIEALEFQTKGAQRKYELGQGTVTDSLDVQVKFEQAKANDLMLRANLSGAKDQFTAITGISPENSDFILPNKHETFKVMSLEEILAKAEKDNPNVMVAKANESIAKYEVAKVSGTFLPTVSYVWQKTNYNAVNSTNNGLSLSIPIDANSYINTYGTYAKAQQSSSQRLATETQTKVEAQRLYALIEAGQESLKIKWKAIDTARLSVVANQKSYEAGVKSTTDVLIAIQTLYQARNDYALSATNQATNYLNLLLVAAEEPDNAIAQTQAFLFRK
jgi:outer membrane protein TolC